MKYAANHHPDDFQVKVFDHLMQRSGNGETYLLLQNVSKMQTCRERRSADKAVL